MSKETTQKLEIPAWVSEILIEDLHDIVGNKKTKLGLNQAGIKTLGDFVKLLQTEDGCRKIQNIHWLGTETIKNITLFLAFSHKQNGYFSVATCVHSSFDVFMVKLFKLEVGYDIDLLRELGFSEVRIHEALRVIQENRTRNSSTKHTRASKHLGRQRI